MDDAALLRAYLDEKSEDAFRAVAQRHLPVVYAAALRQVNGDAHLAEDVAQRVFISLARKAGSLAQRPSILGWLYTATRMEAARAVRTEIRRRRREDEGAAMTTPESDSSLFEPLIPVLDEAMTQLGEADREAVLLRFFSGRSYSEIGHALSISEEAARKRVDRALDKLHDMLCRRGFASTATALGSALVTHAAPPVLPAISATITSAAYSQLATGSAISLSLLMTSTKTLTVIVGVAATVGVFCWHDYRALRSSDAERALAGENLSSAEVRLKTRSVELAAASRELTTLENPPALTTSAPRVVSVAPSYLTEANYRELARSRSKARRHLEFQRLYRQLRLAPDQIEKFEEIMARQDEAQLDAAVARAEGRDEQAVYSKSGYEWNDSMRGLLGDEGLSQLKDYLRAMPVRAFIDQFAVQSSRLELPLSSSQLEQLSALALANDALYQSGKGTDPGTVNWNVVWDPAAKFLTADQLGHLQRTVEVWSLQKQLALQLKADSSPRP
jgi:RNA polymerase sigma factor (sigma-70 family)